jgi:hypothetical protein
MKESSFIVIHGEIIKCQKATTPHLIPVKKIIRRIIKKIEANANDSETGEIVAGVFSVMY